MATVKGPLFLAAVCACALAAGACGSGTSKPGGKLPVGFLDSPKPGEIIRGGYHVQGWALAESGIQDVSIFVDRSFLGKATLGQSRPDLTQEYSMFPSPGSGG